MPDTREVFRTFVIHWQSVATVAIPILLLPIPIMNNTSTFRCAYVALLMALYWMLELLPLSVTALIPVALFPLFGIMTSNEVSMSYMKDTCMLYLGGLILATAIEDCNLHRRVALFVLNHMGTSPRFLLLGFMVSAAFLSMWISNTAACAMMIPILDAILQEVLSVASDPENEKLRIPGQANMKSMLGMAVSIASNIGGTATTIGTGPNLILIGYLQNFDGQPLTFGSWMGFAIPQMVLCLFSAWLFIQFYYLPLPRICCKKNEEQDAIDRENNERIAKLISQKCLQLGRPSFRELSVSALFCTLILLWFFRSPGFLPGWSDAIGYPGIRDGTPAVIIALTLFILPSKPCFYKSKSPCPRLMTWKHAEEKIPWGVIILFGGGFALADGCNKSGLSSWIGNQLSGLIGLNEWILLIIVCLLASVLTQIISNVTTAAVVTPIVFNLAKELRVNPILLMIPPTLICSHGFMLPVSSAPNTMVFQFTGMPTLEMVKVGGAVSLICMATVIVSIMTYGYTMFDLQEFPAWANGTANAF